MCLCLIVYHRNLNFRKPKKQNKNSPSLNIVPFCLALNHTSALLQSVPAVDPLSFLLLTDLNVLLDVHSWRGRDRHSWKHKRPQVQAAQTGCRRRRREDRAEQNKTRHTSMNDGETWWWSSDSAQHKNKTKGEQQQVCEILHPSKCNKCVKCVA